MTKLAHVGDGAMQLVNAGMASVLQCRVSGAHAVYTAPRTIIGIAGNVRRENVAESSIVGSVVRKAAGGPFFLHSVRSASADQPASVLLAPASLGEIALVTVEAGQALHVGRRAFLAATDGIKLCTRLGGGLGVGVDGKLFALEARGSGTLAVHSRGGAVYRLTLQPGEEYHVRPSNILAWSSLTRPLPSPAGFEPAAQTIPSNASLPTLLQHWLWNTGKHVWARLRQSVRSTVTGDRKSFYRLTGPGHFLLSSHVPPRLDGVISAYSSLRHQGEILRESLKTPTSLLMKDSTPFAGAADFARPATAVVSIDSTTGRAVFTYLNKETAAEPAEVAVNKMEEKVDHADTLTASSQSDAVQKVSTMSDAKDMSSAESTPVKITATDTTPTPRKGWRRLLFGNQ